MLGIPVLPPKRSPSNPIAAMEGLGMEPRPCLGDARLNTRSEAYERIRVGVQAISLGKSPIVVTSGVTQDTARTLRRRLEARPESGEVKPWVWPATAAVDLAPPTTLLA